MDKVHSCEINLLLPSFSGYGVVRSSLLMRTPLCGPRLLRNFREESTWLLVQCWSIYQFLRMRKNHVSKFFFLCIFPSFKLLWFVHNRSWEGIKMASHKNSGVKKNIIDFLFWLDLWQIFRKDASSLMFYPLNWIVGILKN